MTVNRNIIGDVVNPITDARLKLQMSINSLSRRLGLSKQYISKAEQGTYTNLNPALLLWVSNALEVSRSEVNKLYWNFQEAQRRQTKEEVAPEKLVRLGREEKGHELFKAWREEYWPSHIAFATAFCFHPETVKMYEDGIRPTMPHPIRSTLEKLDLLDSIWVDSPKFPIQRSAD